MKKMLRKMYKAVVVLMLVPLAVNAAIVLNETFEDGSRTDGVPTSWYATEKTSNTTIAIGTDSVLTSGNVLSLTTTSTSTSINRRMVGEFATQTLTNVGDWISLSVDFRMPNFGTTSSVNRAFKVGLTNTSGSSLTGDLNNSNEPTSTTTNALSNDKGYFVGIGMGTTGTTALVREDGTGATFLGGTDLAFLTPTAGTSPQLQDLLAHSLVLTITKDSATTVRVDFNLDGGAIDLTAAGGSTVYTAFNEVGFATGSYGTGFIIDNVVVSIPEPATIALLSLGCLVFRKRK